jgi:hypothetical protein
VNLGESPAARLVEGVGAGGDRLPTHPEHLASGPAATQHQHSESALSKDSPRSGARPQFRDLVLLFQESLVISHT